MKLRIALALAAVAAPIAPPAAAQALADLAPAGRELAERWCAACHAVTPAQPPPQGDATSSFAAIAARPATTEASLRVFLQTPHAGMPDFQLSREQIDALVDHILSLRR